MQVSGILRGLFYYLFLEVRFAGEGGTDIGKSCVVRLAESKWFCKMITRTQAKRRSKIRAGIIMSCSLKSALQGSKIYSTVLGEQTELKYSELTDENCTGRGFCIEKFF